MVAQTRRISPGSGLNVGTAMPCARPERPAWSEPSPKARKFHIEPLAAVAGAAYLAALLALDHYASYPGQLALGALTWVLLAAVLVRVSPERRAQALGVVVFATIGEVTGS